MPTERPAKVSTKRAWNDLHLKTTAWRRPAQKWL